VQEKEEEEGEVMHHERGEGKVNQKLEKL